MSLIEMVVALSISSMLLITIGGTITIAVQTLPSKKDGSMAYLDHATRLDQIATEIRYAKTIIASSSTMIEFTVHDRDSDTVDEVIRYEWSGTPGDPLTRQYNGGTVANFIDSVENLNLQYVVAPGEITESAEQLLSNDDPTVLPSNYDYGLSIGDMVAGTCLPNLPPEATKWKVSKIEINLNPVGGTSGVFDVDITEVANDGTPAETQIIESVQIAESTLAGGFREIVFTNVDNLDPTKPIAVVVKGVSGTGSLVKVRAGWGGPLNPNTMLFESSGGNPWSSALDERVYIRVYGTVTTPRDLLSYMNIKIQYGSDATDCVNASVPTLNKPAM